MRRAGQGHPHEEGFLHRRGPEYAQRGQIYTSDHENVAINVKKYKIILVLSSQRTGYGKKLAYVKDVNKTASQLGPILGIDVNELTSKLQIAKDQGRYK